MSSAKVSPPDADRPPRRPRRLWRALLALALGFVFAFAAGEMVCRLEWGVPVPEREPLMEVRAHPTRGFEMIPSTEHYTYMQRVRVNAMGLRGAELTDDAARQASGEARVLCLGDSFVYGQGLAEDETLPAQLERLLNSRTSTGARPVRVVNGGLRAYNTRQELALLEEMLPRVRPDIVVLFWYANDLETVDVESMARGLERSGPITFDVGGRMDDAARRSWRFKQVARHSALVMKLHDAWTDLRWRDLSPRASDDAFARLDGELAGFAELARAHDFDAIVAVIPASELLSVEDDAGSPAPRVLALARAHGLDGIDLATGLRAQWRRELRLHVIPYDGHYDGAADAAMAQQVADELQARCIGRLAR